MNVLITIFLLTYCAMAQKNTFDESFPLNAYQTVAQGIVLNIYTVKNKQD